MTFEVVLKSGASFDVYGKNYQFDCQYFTVLDENGDNVFVIKTHFLLRVKAIYPEVDTDDFYKMRVIFDCM